MAGDTDAPSRVEASAVPLKRRRRAALSCIQCRRRKVRCDRERPCDQCIQLKSPVACFYTREDDDLTSVVHGLFAATTPPASLRTPGPEIRERANATPVRGVSGPSTIRAPSSPSFLRTWSEPSIRDTPPESSRGNSGLEQLSQAASRRPDEASRVSQLPEVAHPMRGSLSKTRFFGQSHWMTTIPQFSTMSRIIKKPGPGSDGTSSDDQGVTEAFRLLEMCKRMARVIKTARPTQLLSFLDLRNSVPSRDLSDQLVHLYMRTSESTFRILHIPTFDKEYLEYWSDPQAANPDFVVKLLLVMAIGTSFYQSASCDVDTLRSLAHQWVYGAQQWLSAPSEKSRLNLSWLQVQCLLQLARQTNDFDGDLIWITIGSILRMAFNMGLHRDPKHFPYTTVYASEMRRRLWHTIVEMAVQASLDAGMPPLISLHDFDCEAPSNIDDAEIEETTKLPPESRPKSHFTQTSIQITLLTSLPVRLRIARSINDFRVDMSYDEVLRLGADLTNACRESTSMMEEYLMPSTGQHISRFTDFHRCLLDLLTRRFLLALHRAFAIKARTDPRFYFSRKVCLETAMIFISFVGDLSPQSNSLDDFTRLAIMAGGSVEGALVHDATMSICLELLTQLEEETSGGSSTTVSARSNIINQVSRTAREPLVRAAKHMLELARCRIIMGQTNVKGHVFLSAILAQINATELGEPPEPAILKAAKESAETCYELLHTRAASLPSEQNGQHLDNEQFEFNTGPGQDLSFETLMQDPNMKLDSVDSWLYLAWDDNDAWL